MGGRLRSGAHMHRRIEYRVYRTTVYIATWQGCITYSLTAVTAECALTLYTTGLTVQNPDRINDNVRSNGVQLDALSRSRPRRLKLKRLSRCALRWEPQPGALGPQSSAHTRSRQSPRATATGHRPDHACSRNLYPIRSPLGVCGACLWYVCVAVMRAVIMRAVIMRAAR